MCEYEKLWVKFTNLFYAANAWYYLMLIIADYAAFFETEKEKYKTSMQLNIEKLLEINRIAKEKLGDKFYCIINSCGEIVEYIQLFVEEVLESFKIEEKAVACLKDEKDLTDYIVCGGVTEGHYLQKEVNFSDTLIKDGALCRIPGSVRGMGWCSVNAHGWFSYLIKVKPGCENTIKILAGSSGEDIDVKITVGNREKEFHEKAKEKTELVINYTPEKGEDFVRIRFDKISANTPCIYTIKVL